MKFNGGYFIAFVLLLLTEVGIALYVHDDFIRPFIGDALVVILIYLFWRSFMGTLYRRLPFYVFLFAVAVEIGQYFHIVKLLGLEQSDIMRTAIGSTFDFMDIVSYFGGFLCLLVWEAYERRGSRRGVFKK